MAYNLPVIEIRETDVFSAWLSSLRDAQTRTRVQARILGLKQEPNMAKKLQTRPYDAAAYLKSKRDCALYLQAAIDESDGEPAVVVAALGDIARARGMMQLARDTGLTREGLYKALSPEGNPSFATVMKVCKALGLKMHTEPA